MYERFTDRSRRVMQLANKEAQRFHHDYIGTEHILLGITKESGCLAATIVESFGVDIGKVRMEVEKIVKSGPEMVTMGKLPYTPRAKKAIGHAIEESNSLNHNYVGTEHLLIGLSRGHKGIAAQVLVNLGLKLEDVRKAALSLISQNDKNEKLGRETIRKLTDPAELVRRTAKCRAYELGDIHSRVSVLNGLYTKLVTEGKMTVEEMGQRMIGVGEFVDLFNTLETQQ